MNPPSPDDASRAWLELPDGTQHALGDLCTIGRKPGNAVVLPDPTVSSSHAVIQRGADQRWSITDLRSTNGTYVGGRKISAPVLLVDRAAVRIGPFTLTFHQPDTTAPEGTQGLVAPTTVVQTYNGPCWLLLLDLENFTARRQALGEARTSALMRAWTIDVRSIVETNGGTLNSQPGDALLFYWRDDASAVGASVDTTLRALIALQLRATELGFRIVLHHGVAQLSIGELRVEQLAGAEVDFLFRLEKMAKPLGTRCLLSERAAVALDVRAETRPLGTHSVPSFVGRFQLHAFGPPLSASVVANPLPAPVIAPERRGVLLVAPAGAAADGLEQLLAAEHDLLVIGHATSGREARRLHAAKRPHATLIDLAADEADILTLIRDLGTCDAGGRILVLSSRADSPLVERSLRNGATGAILRHEPTSELLLAVRTVLNGSVYLSRRIAATVLRGLAGSDDGGRRGGPSVLSDRELEIFHLIATGKQNREIAEALGVSVKTVESHKENIKLKLGLKSTADVAVAAREWLDSARSRPPF